MKRPFLSVTVNSRLTRVTSTWMRVGSSLWSDLAGGPGGVLPGGRIRRWPARPRPRVAPKSLIWSDYSVAGAQPFHPGLQLRGQRRFDRDLLARGGLVEADAAGVQEVAAQRRPALHFGRRAVERVAGHGVADARQVHADLVRAAGADPHFEQREPFEPAQHAVFGPRRAAFVEARGHAGAAHGVAGDGPFHTPALVLHLAVHQRQVDLLHLPARRIAPPAADGRRRSWPPAGRRWYSGRAGARCRAAARRPRRRARRNDASSALTTVPEWTPAPAWTTMPAGLSMATTSRSS